MICQHPIQVKAKEKGSNLVSCGHCIPCLINESRDWQTRLHEELRHSKNAYFITLTYSENPISLNLFDLRAFLKRLRNSINYQYKLSKDGKKVADFEENRSNLRFFAVGEYGEHFTRPHYHILLFNIPIFAEPNGKFHRDREIHKTISNAWTKGFIKIGTVTHASIKYVTKYCFKNKGKAPNGCLKPFRLMSKNPAIGKTYITTHKDYHNRTLETVTTVLGRKGRMPYYYKRNIFSDQSKESIKNKRLKEIDQERERLYINQDLKTTFKELSENLIKENSFNQSFNYTKL